MSVFRLSSHLLPSASGPRCHNEQVVTSGARLRLFIDESYGTDDYYVAGVLVTESQYNRLVTGLDGLRLHAGVKFGLEPEVEFHAHRLMQAQGEWACMKGQLHEAVAVTPSERSSPQAPSCSSKELTSGA